MLPKLLNFLRSFLVTQVHPKFPPKLWQKKSEWSTQLPEMFFSPGTAASLRPGAGAALRLAAPGIWEGRPRPAYGNRVQDSPIEMAKILRCWRIRRCSATFWGVLWVLWVLYPNSKGTNLGLSKIYQYVWQRAIKGGYPPLLDKPVWQFCLAIGQDYGIQNRNRQLAGHFSKGKSICVCHTHPYCAAPQLWVGSLKKLSHQPLVIKKI